MDDDEWDGWLVNCDSCACQSLKVRCHARWNKVEEGECWVPMGSLNITDEQPTDEEPHA